MRWTPDDPTLAEITRRLVETYRPERIYLFGSAFAPSGPDGSFNTLTFAPQSWQSDWDGLLAR